MLYPRWYKVLSHPASFSYRPRAVRRLYSSNEVIPALPAPPTDLTPPPKPVPKPAAILEQVLIVRRRGEKLVDTEEHELYKLYLYSRRPKVNVSKLDESIVRLFIRANFQDDLNLLTKLSERLEQREWYGLASRIQSIIVDRHEGRERIDSLRRLAELAAKNRDYKLAQASLERLQSQLTEMLVEQATNETDFEKANTLYVNAAQTGGDMDLVEVLYRHSELLSQQPNRAKEAIEKLREALATIKRIAKVVVDKMGSVPVHYSEKVDALPTWQKRIGAKIEQLEADSP